MAESRRNTLGLIGQLVVLSAAMFAFGFALVPLYDVFCEITGFGGKTENQAVLVTEAPDEDRLVTVEFVTTVNELAPWDFRPTVSSIQVHPGKLYRTTFQAENLTATALVGQAVPSVAPSAAATHFKKTECFCFTSQAFEPSETKDMPVQFMVDNELPRHVERITLSYTLFKNETLAAN